MTVLRCTAALLKRMKYPAKPEEPEPQRNPLGEWYADLLIWKRHPMVVLMNADTGVPNILPILPLGRLITRSRWRWPGSG